jgi:hypothetical protein
MWELKKTICLLIIVSINFIENARIILRPLYLWCMKRAIAFFLSLVFIFVLSFRATIVFVFIANQKQITEQYCENKKRPELHCNGQCHLKKQLQETPIDTPQNLPEYLKLTYTEESTVSNNISISYLRYPSSVIHNFVYTLHLPTGTTFPVFHPPDSSS